MPSLNRPKPQVFLLPILNAVFLISFEVISASGQTIANNAYQLLSQRVGANQSAFYVYQDQDAGFNHGFPSGLFGNTKTVHIDAGCVDDSTSATGCSIDPNRLDRTRGNVLKIAFDPQGPADFSGINLEEPEKWATYRTGSGYDLTGATNVVFDVRSPNGANVQFGVDGCTTAYVPIAQNWTTLTIPLASLQSCSSDFSHFQNVHILFGVATNYQHAPNGAIILLDNIRFEPTPINHRAALGFPAGNQTFGIVPAQNTPIPSDQVLRNLTTIYESALTGLTLLARGNAQDLANARLIADTFDYVLHHDNHGDPIPAAPDGSFAAHNGYENGDLALYNDQSEGKTGRAGDVRLAGFTATTLCPATGFCLVLDGATGGNNAFAILLLVAAYEQFQDIRYLNDARAIGRWIISNLADTTGNGYGGYYIGYPDMGVPPPKPLQTGKSTENNADIFAGFRALRIAANQIGNTAEATMWSNAANAAGDFVIQMFDPVMGRFNAGTVPPGVTGIGLCPNGQRKGNDVVSTCDFLDSNTFTTLAMADSARYQNQLDWRRPVQFVLNTFGQTVSAAGQSYQGFDIVTAPVSGPNGIAWEFTGQAVASMRLVDQIYADTRFDNIANFYLGQIEHAQTAAPFGDGLGLVASTVQNGDTLAPVNQCLNTPFQCIAERVGLAATTWGILADRNVNGFNLFTSMNPVFVNEQYVDLLARQADAGGLSYWTALLNSGMVTRGQTAAAFFTSNEFSSGGLFIIKLYEAILKRDPDFAGWSYWFSVLRSGVAADTVKNAFLESQEFKSTYGNQTNSDFVTLLYRNVLGRDPDSGGLTYWVGLLANGTLTRAGIVDAFIDSAEYNNRILPRAYANLLYMGFLRRTSDPAGLAYWTGVIGQTNGLFAAINSFITSAEYAGRF